MSAGDAIVAGVLLAVGGGAYLINHNRKVRCYLCGDKFKNGHMQTIKEVADEQLTNLDWYGGRPDSVDIIAKTRIFNGTHYEEALRLSNEERNNHNEPVGNQKVCRGCIENIKKTLRIEAERVKVPCPLCCKKVWERALDVPDRWVLPEYWKTPDDFENKVCSDCRHDIENREIELWKQVQEESKAFGDALNNEYECHSINHLGNWTKRIDESTVVRGIKSSFYRDKDDALAYLWERAYYEGYNIIFNVKTEKDTDSKQAYCRDEYESPNHVRGVYHYSVFSATGDFAKRKA